MQIRDIGIGHPDESRRFSERSRIDDDDDDDDGDIKMIIFKP